MNWLNDSNIPFVIRGKANQLATNSRGQEIEVSALFYNVKRHDIKGIEDKRKVSGVEVYLLGTRDKNSELLFVMSNCDDVEALLPIYGMR